MPENVKICPLCGSDRSQLFDKRDFRGRLVENRLCLNCGLVYQSPRMTEAESAEYYRAEYRRTYQGEEGPVKRDLAVQTARARSLIDFVKPRVASVSRCLDIGSSTGLILEAFRDSLGCEIVGVEPGDAYRDLAIKKGLKVYPTLDKLEQAGEKRFDMVIMSHVLEHLPAPVSYLAHLRENLLDREGWLLIEVPNLYAHESFEPAHLLAFSSHILRETLRQGGFEIVKYKKHGKPNSAILPLYLTVLCRPAAEFQPTPIKPERGVAFKRWQGMGFRHVAERLLPGLAWLTNGKEK
jgi:2-polyprenyl-3-methyl-5-hydroxy-6-metoxy-1,4-benzoquinol methylase